MVREETPAQEADNNALDRRRTLCLLRCIAAKRGGGDATAHQTDAVMTQSSSHDVFQAMQAIEEVIAAQHSVGHITGVPTHVVNDTVRRLKALLAHHTSFVLSLALPLVFRTLPAYLHTMLRRHDVDGSAAPLTTGTQPPLQPQDVDDMLVALRFLLQRQHLSGAAEREMLAHTWSSAVHGALHDALAVAAASSTSPRHCVRTLCRAIDTAVCVADVHVFPHDAALGHVSVYDQAAAAYAQLSKAMSVRVAQRLAQHLAHLLRAHHHGVPSGGGGGYGGAFIDDSGVDEEDGEHGGCGVQSVAKVVAALRCAVDIAPLHERLLAHRLIRSRTRGVHVERDVIHLLSQPFRVSPVLPIKATVSAAGAHTPGASPAPTLACHPRAFYCDDASPFAACSAMLRECDDVVATRETQLAFRASVTRRAVLHSPRSPPHQVEAARQRSRLLLSSSVRLFTQAVWGTRVPGGSRCLVGGSHLDVLHPQLGAVATSYERFYRDFTGGKRCIKWLLSGGSVVVDVLPPRGTSPCLRLVTTTLQAIILHWFQTARDAGLHTLTLGDMTARFAARGVGIVTSGGGDAKGGNGGGAELERVLCKELLSLTASAHPVRDSCCTACSVV